jgi:hypothetical protein
MRCRLNRGSRIPSLPWSKLSQSLRERGGLHHAGKVRAGVAVPAAELDKLGDLGKDGAALGSADNACAVPLAQFEKPFVAQ